MSRDFTDDIDECCEAILGHNNWGFLYTPDIENYGRKIKNNPTKGVEIAHIVVFYKNQED